MSGRLPPERLRAWLAYPLACLAWAIPHLAAVGWLALRWPLVQGRSRAALYGWWLVAAPIAVALTHDVVTGGAEFGSRRWAVALDILWVGLLLPWLYLSRRTVVAAAALVMAIALIASVATALRWLQPTWVEVGTGLAVVEDDSIAPVSEWLLRVRTLGGSRLLVTPHHDASEFLDPLSRVVLSGNSVAAVSADDVVTWPNTPHVSLAATWSDGTAVAGRTFRVVGSFDAGSAVGPMGCRGWRFGWWVDGRLAQTCEPNAWSAGPVDVARTASIPETADGVHWRLTWYDVGTVEQRWSGLRVEERVEGRWRDVTGALSPVHPLVVGAPSVVSHGPADASDVRLALPPGVQPSATVSVRSDGGVLVRAGQVPRWAGWTTHANVMAHLLVVALATVMVLARRTGLSLLAAPAGVLAIAFTGSRSGLVAGLLVVMASLLWRAHGRWRWMLPIAVALATGAAVFLSDRLGTLLRLTGPEDNLLSRWEIMQLSWQAVRSAPWTGDPTGIVNYAMNELGLRWPALPMHAHNLWLDLGALFGMPALIGFSIWTLGLLIWCLRADRLRRASLVVPMLIVSLTDATLLVPAIAVPFGVALSTLAREPNRPPQFAAGASTLSTTRSRVVADRMGTPTTAASLDDEHSRR